MACTRESVYLLRQLNPPKTVNRVIIYHADRLHESFASAVLAGTATSGIKTGDYLEVSGQLGGNSIIAKR